VSHVLLCLWPIPSHLTYLMPITQHIKCSILVYLVLSVSCTLCDTLVSLACPISSNVSEPITKHMKCSIQVSSLASEVSFNLNLQSESPWSPFHGTWQKRPGELESRLRFEIKEMTLQMLHSNIHERVAYTLVSLTCPISSDVSYACHPTHEMLDLGIPRLMPIEEQTIKEQIKEQMKCSIRSIPSLMPIEEQMNYSIQLHHTDSTLPRLTPIRKQINSSIQIFLVSCLLRNKCTALFNSSSSTFMFCRCLKNPCFSVTCFNAVLFCHVSMHLVFKFVTYISICQSTQKKLFLAHTFLCSCMIIEFSKKDQFYLF